MKNVNFCFFFMLIFFSVSAWSQTGNLELKEDGRLASLLTDHAELIKNNEIGNRYKIQLGSYGEIKDAERIKKKFEGRYPDLPVRLQYESPNYKVWAGDFTSRLGADRVFLKIKNHYKSAFVFRPNN